MGDFFNRIPTFFLPLDIFLPLVLFLGFSLQAILFYGVWGHPLRWLYTFRHNLQFLVEKFVNYFQAKSLEIISNLWYYVVVKEISINYQLGGTETHGK